MLSYARWYVIEQRGLPSLTIEDYMTLSYRNNKTPRPPNTVRGLYKIYKIFHEKT